jgi:hypothetical protein
MRIEEYHVPPPEKVDFSTMDEETEREYWDRLDAQCPIDDSNPNEV